MPTKVHTHIAGSYCTVQLLPNWELYIEARKNIRLPSFSFIEVVGDGTFTCEDCDGDEVEIQMYQLTPLI